jgi:dTDP-4-amino-4,6-dideoxy-D-glucose acyltransferase
MDRFLSRAELMAIGLAHVGDAVAIDRSVILINPAGVSIGDNTRVDAFCLISGGTGVQIGRNVHIAAGAYIYGGGGVTICDFVGISARSVIYSTNDDYSGEVMTGPTLPADFTRVTVAPVKIGRHVVVGAGSVILPGVTIGDGAATGALSLVKHNVESFTIVAGNPLRVIGARSRHLLDLEKEYLRAGRKPTLGVHNQI